MENRLLIKTPHGIYKIPSRFTSITFKQGENFWPFGKDASGLEIEVEPWFIAISDIDVVTFIPCTEYEAPEIIDTIYSKLSSY